MVNIYKLIVFIPILPKVDTSFIEIIPDTIDTNIKGRTIILSKIRKSDDMVENIFPIKNDSINVYEIK